ncbi:hypothetical protein BC629DRAFT_1595974 [Irpex lacteus]|nr:hypothetical protein BC629DRAFT_1595974 [Irpex lacteus]
MDTEGQQQYTILRIKRKRNEEPLDALGKYGSRRKKTKGPINVFQFAETVEPTTWQDEKQKEDLQARITNLARREVITKRGLQFAKPPPEGASAGASTDTETVEDKEVKPPHKPPRIDDPARKYTIVPSESVQTPVKTASRGRATEPPKIHSYKELQKASVTMYEAIPSSTSLANTASEDAEMAKFLPMLNDYLRLNGEDSSVSASSSGAVDSTEDDDYVWDVFYSRPATFREFYASYSNVGTVTGLPDDDEAGSGSDSEYDDELDEDSNAEDWYKNDYPDEESASEEEIEDGGDSEGSDVFHEDSDFEELVHDRPTQMWEHR